MKEVDESGEVGSGMTGNVDRRKREMRFIDSVTQRDDQKRCVQTD